MHSLGPGVLATSIEEACHRWWDRPAVTFGDRTISYGQLWASTEKLAAAYRQLGIGAGDRVICQLPNSPEHLMAIAAAWACGSIHAGTDHDLTGPELASLVGRTDAAALLFQPQAGADDPFSPLRAVEQSHPNTKVFMNADHGIDGHRTLADIVGSPARAEPPPALAPAATGPEHTATGPDETALLLLTSGTTGVQKAVMETLAHGWAKMQFFSSAFRPGPHDTHLAFLPMGHVFGLRLSLIPLLTGGRVVLLDRFSPKEALRLIADEGVTVLPGMPAHFNLILAQLDKSPVDVSSLRWAISAASALPPALFAQIRERLGVEMLFVYGCSEGFTTQTTDPVQIERGSVGNLVFKAPDGNPPNGTIGVMDPEGNFLGAGETGEIVFGASHPVRYWDAPPVATDGWYHTGDLGHLDEIGCVYISGRLKELVNRGGLKVSPSEVEVVIAQHPHVADAAVVATPNPVLGEAVCACIVAVSGSTPPTLAELRDFLGESLARHKLPDELCAVPSIPRTKIGKVDRSGLQQVVADLDHTVERLRPR